MSVLRTEGLGVTVGGRRLISALDWRIERGQLWCVLGKNGVGKTSLLYVLSGLLRAASGRLFVRERSIDDWPADALAHVRGLMPQQQSDAFSHSALDMALVGRTPYRLGGAWDTNEDRVTALDALEAVGMRDRAAADILRLSGGERQRVALASLLTQNPELMLLDEPTAHQDVAHQLMIMRLIGKLTADHALVMTCHDINLAARFATHVLVLADDRYWSGPVEEVLTTQILEQAFGCTFEMARLGRELSFIAR